MDHAVPAATPLDLFQALSEIPIGCRDRSLALGRIAELGRRALGSRAFTLTAIDLERRSLTQVACSPSDEAFALSMQGREARLGSLQSGSSLDFDLAAKGEIIERYGIQQDGQGVARAEVARHHGLDAVLCYPLKAPDRLIGYINHFSGGPDRFSQRERNLLAVFARQAVATIESLDNLASRQRLEKLNAIMRDMTEVRDADELLALTLERGLELIDCSRGWISSLDSGTGQLRIVAHRGGLGASPPLPLGRGITGFSLQQGVPVRVSDVQEPPWRRVYEQYWDDTRSELAVPILIGDAEVRVGREVERGAKLMGVLNAESPCAGAFTKADEELLWSLARHAAVLIDRLDLDRKLGRLAEIQQKIVGVQDWDTIVDVMLSAITETLGYERVNISLVDWERSEIRTEYLTGLSEADAAEFKRLAAHPLSSRDIQADIVRSRQIEVPSVVDPRFDPGIFEPFHHERLIRVFVPMIQSDNQVMGTVEAAYQRAYRQHIYEQDVRILKGFVDYTVRALEQRRKGTLDTICHELRAPVVGIRNNASFLQRRRNELSPGLVQRKFDDILMDCEILLLQVKELEHFLGRSAPSTRVVKTFIFRDIIIKTVKQLRPLVRERGFDPSRIEYDGSAVTRVRPLYVDRQLLNQVVYNLVINAIKYAEDDPGKFRIWITAHQTRDEFVVVFQDWGIGILPEYEGKIFHEGFRTPEAIRKYATGSGLGLKIARQIMRELGGDLRLTRNQQPTEFQMILPKRLKEKPDDTDS